MNFIQTFHIDVLTSIALGMKIEDLKLKECGGYSVKWLFVLAANAPCDGYIVQQIDIDYDAQTCKAKIPISIPHETLWEYWPVPMNYNVPSPPKQADGWTRDPTDNIRQATYAVEGKLKFFCKTKTGELTWKDRQTHDKPDFWDDPALEEGGWRKLLSTWTCCCDEKWTGTVIAEKK